MTIIAIAGGTGLAGRAIAAEASSRGHSVRLLSRSAPTVLPEGDVSHHAVELESGSGLSAALAGVEVVVDATNGTTRRARRVLTDGARSIVEAAATAGVSRTVLLSIVAVERSAFSYYRAKAAQEQIYRASTVPTAICRATQFHDFPVMFFEQGVRAGVIPAFPGISFQTIAVGDVAIAIVDAAESAHPHDVLVGGPEVRTMHDLATEWKAVTGSRARVVSLPLPGALGSFFRGGAHLVPDHTEGTVTFDEWLSRRVSVAHPSLNR